MEMAPRTSLVAAFMVTHDDREDHLLWYARSVRFVSVWSGSRLRELATRARPVNPPRSAQWVSTTTGWLATGRSTGLSPTIAGEERRFSWWRAARQADQRLCCHDPEPLRTKTNDRAGFSPSFDGQKQLRKRGRDHPLDTPGSARTSSTPAPATVSRPVTTMITPTATTPRVTIKPTRITTAPSASRPVAIRTRERRTRSMVTFRGNSRVVAAQSQRTANARFPQACAVHPWRAAIPSHAQD
jgi:hypothetical protein